MKKQYVITIEDTNSRSSGSFLAVFILILLMAAGCFYAGNHEIVKSFISDTQASSQITISHTINVYACASDAYNHINSTVQYSPGDYTIDLTYDGMNHIINENVSGGWINPDEI